MRTRIVHCIGNPLVPEDRLALDVADALRIHGISFVKVLSPEELFSERPAEVTILDVARGIRRVTVFTDLSRLRGHRLLSLHDFDLATVLRLMEGMGLLPRLTIIALPMGSTVDAVLPRLRQLLTRRGPARRRRLRPRRSGGASTSTVHARASRPRRTGRARA